MYNIYVGTRLTDAADSCIVCVCYTTILICFLFNSRRMCTTAPDWEIVVEICFYFSIIHKFKLNKVETCNFDRKGLITPTHIILLYISVDCSGGNMPADRIKSYRTVVFSVGSQLYCCSRRCLAGFLYYTYNIRREVDRLLLLYVYGL